MLEEANVAAVGIEEIRRIVREEVERAMKKDPAARKVCLIASKGTHAVPLRLRSIFRRFQVERELGGRASLSP